MNLPVHLRSGCKAAACTFPINTNVYTARSDWWLLIRGALQGLLFLSETDVFSLSVGYCFVLTLKGLQDVVNGSCGYPTSG